MENNIKNNYTNLSPWINSYGFKNKKNKFSNLLKFMRTSPKCLGFEDIS